MSAPTLFSLESARRTLADQLPAILDKAAFLETVTLDMTPELDEDEPDLLAPAKVYEGGEISPLSARVVLRIAGQWVWRFDPHGIDPRNFEAAVRFAILGWKAGYSTGSQECRRYAA